MKKFDDFERDFESISLYQYVGYFNLWFAVRCQTTNPENIFSYFRFVSSRQKSFGYVVKQIEMKLEEKNICVTICLKGEQCGKFHDKVSTIVSRASFIAENF